MSMNNGIYQTDEGTIAFVQCPSREPDELSLITPQIIPQTLCDKRQTEHFHKCPRCLNRCELAELFAGSAA
jgi:hypothetical protein